jgi:hypothetical protein
MITRRLTNLLLLVYNTKVTKNVSRSIASREKGIPV